MSGEDLTPYRRASKAIMAVLSRFGPAERLGLDEVRAFGGTRFRNTMSMMPYASWHGQLSCSGLQRTCVASLPPLYFPMVDKRQHAALPALLQLTNEEAHTFAGPRFTSKRTGIASLCRSAPARKRTGIPEYNVSDTEVRREVQKLLCCHHIHAQKHNMPQRRSSWM